MLEGIHHRSQACCSAWHRWLIIQPVRRRMDHRQLQSVYRLAGFDYCHPHTGHCRDILWYSRETLMSRFLTNRDRWLASQLAGVDIIPSELDRLADKLLERYAAKFATIGHPQLAAYIVVGDPRKSLIEASTDLKADLLVIGSRGLSKLQGMVLGSVSEYCVQHSKVPVLVTKLESKTASTSSKWCAKYNKLA